MTSRSTHLAAIAGAALLVVGAAPALGQDADWAAPYDPAKAAEQAAEFQTYGMPDSWANYGESIAQFCATMQFDPCTRVDTDMSSLEEITAFDAEKANPVAAFADIGIMFGPIADAAGVVPAFLPPNADVLPEGFKSANGGWFATFTGVPGFNVNVTALEERGIAIPTTWADLVKPEYKGLIGIGVIGESGTATTSFIAMNLAAGGTVTDFAPGIEYGRALLPNIEGVPEASTAEMERGEVPIQVKYDFNLIAQANELAAKGLDVRTVIPADGSLYAASALMLNGYNTAEMDLTKAFAEWVLSDAGQTIFAEFGARPIRYVLGDLQLPDEAKAKWLPDADYAAVQAADLSQTSIEAVKEIWEVEVLGQ